MLWRFDPPYPSITLVMTKYQAETFDISQLPAPGRSVLERCQLRAKKNTPRQGQDRLLMTVDYRYTVQPTVGVTTIPSSLSTTRCEPIRHPDERPEEDDKLIVDVEEYEDSAAANRERLVRGKLAAALASLLQILRLKFVARQV